MDDVFTQLEQAKQASVDRLCDWLRIESVSTDSAYKAECQRAAEWIAKELTDCGLEAKVHPTPGHPVVVGKTTTQVPDAPRVLFYGHYDVQPPDPLELWATPAFEPTVRDGAIYARGASDDKGQVMCFVEALRAWKAAGRELPINLTVMIEGEEECGAVHLDDFIEANQNLLAADIAVVSDSSMWDRDTPAITYALRGLSYFDLKLHGPDRDLHSGVYGGTMANPATQLTAVLGQLFDADRKVTIPGFYDDVAELTGAERAEWEKLDFTDEKYAASIGVDELAGEAGFTTLERRWARPSCDINGLYGGYMGEGAKTVIPSFAGAKVSFRLAANQDPRKIGEGFRQWLIDHTPPGCRWEISEFAGARPVIVSTDSPYMKAAQQATQAGYGREAVLVREGATIPVVATFKSMLGIDTLLLGFGLNDDAIHSPNEKFELGCYEAGCRTHAALIEQLGKIRAGG